MRIVALLFLAGCLSLLQVAAVSSGLQHGRKDRPSASTQTPNQLPMTNMGGLPDDPGAADPVERARRAKYNQERQTQARADARRLADLSRELLDDLERADGRTLPADTFRKTNEIIKLAKSVKDKMRPV